MNRTEMPVTRNIVESVDDAKSQTIAPLVVLDPLVQFLDDRNIGSGQLSAEEVGEGHSNVTILLERGGSKFILRRPPRPPLPPSAHNVIREAGIKAAVGSYVPVPEVLATCEDESIIGSPFYVMEFIEGQVIGPAFPKQFEDLDASGFGETLVDVLVDLHAVDYRDTPLAQSAKPEGYLARQLKRFAGLWSSERTREVPEIDDAAEWLSSNIPASPRASIVHGDYRLGNSIFGRQDSRPKLLAVLDWEMATVGDPLADLGYMLAMWSEPGEPETPMSKLSIATTRPGFSSRDELRERYSRRSKVDVSDVGWYEILALWKASIFLECSFRRYVSGKTDDPYFAELDEGVPQLARETARRRSLL